MKIARLAVLLGLLSAELIAATSAAPKWGRLRLEIALPSASARPVVRGRLFVFVARTATNEPRIEKGASLFAAEVRDFQPGQQVAMDASVPGFPEQTLGDLAPGDYSIQAVLDIYSRFPRADGHVVWAHDDQWEGQDFARSPGNLMSAPKAVRVGSGSVEPIRLTLDQVIPALPVLSDTEWVKRIKFTSPLLSHFWGRPIYLGATVLLPKGYASHPEVRYPVVYIQGHFSLAAPFGFAPELPGSPSDARPKEKAPRSEQGRESGQEFYRSWTAEDFPRVICVTFQHPTPYFDDSYGVNSPNCGPYGDAILEELIPAIERRFRTLPHGYARVLTGSSTGGWGSLALQLYHPDFFGGAWAFSPDPVDFRLYYGGVDLYADENAFVAKPGHGFEGGGASNRLGSQKTIVLGMQDGRFEWWKHTPVGPDGTPLPVWDPITGQIDHEVVRQMREHDFDLREYLARNWAQLGPKLIAKVHVCAADTDVFYSNLAVHLLEDFMRHTQNPHVDGSFRYGPPGSRHGWQPMSNAELIREMASHIAEHDPDPSEAARWHYP